MGLVCPTSDVAEHWENLTLLDMEARGDVDVNGRDSPKMFLSENN